MKKILLINPWIYDFAVYNFGIKPVGLLRIAEYLRCKGNKVYFIDCLEGCERSRDEYGFSKIKKQKVATPDILQKIKRPYFRYGISINEFIAKLKEIEEVDEIYVTSGMTYWYPGVQLAIELAKEYFKDAPILLGGIYATICYKHASYTSGADIICKGAYLDSELFFEKGFYPAYDLLQDKTMLPVQLTRGCPFKCSYCASRLLSPYFEMRNPVDLFEEVMFYNKTFGTRNFLFYDDALTYKSIDGIKQFLRMIIAVKPEFTFHTPNGLHAKFIDEELADLLKKANFKDIRISLETTDKDLQEFTGAKVTNDDLKRALRNLKEAGFSKNDLGVYLLIGAAWLDIEKTKMDVVYINSLGAKAILASYSPIPGTKDYKILTANKIIKRDMDPLWHNKAVFPELLVPSYLEKIQEMRRFTAALNKI